ncbi:PD40 domain-containing protein [candidate division KSB1 bacterium]|nr:PD40 domain-containing protein [candidate division KSB1 bacterium]MBL7092949.1 PD40 domain-containing protein [candidate division KSB1 bacterium]
METIFLLPVEGGKRRSVVKFKDQYMASFAWSPDAKKLYFARGTFQDGSTSLWFKDLETEEMIDLGLKISFMRELQLHPDGQTLVFQAAEVNFEIWAMEDF